MLGRPIDVIETSRGCTFDCSFCSIIAMRGRNFHTYDFGRVIEDIQDAYRHGARALFVVDDNITLNATRFEALCRAIIAAKLNTIDYTVQAMTSSIANHGSSLAPLMREAGFRYVFLGIENILAGDLKFLRADSKNEERQNGRIANITIWPFPRGTSTAAARLASASPPASVPESSRSLALAPNCSMTRSRSGLAAALPLPPQLVQPRRARPVEVG